MPFHIIKKIFDTNFQIFANSLQELTKTYPLYKEYPNYEPYLKKLSK